nr:immunoglobulin heavy chain junction region [Macaca mulatta]MOW23655.1 immunoglobulin heavy chain junction region [Macaca mulatta]MOW23681.1 immunoglobulin heavy chain junction region [Macaca mulatta]MOW23857.1 immunoglobulin heavy chain junction region [Macaca mulatta]MOW24584.1 immunoglobulin heavy chain junction region [Macaca mulatta]
CARVRGVIIHYYDYW